MDQLSEAFNACASYFGVLAEPMRLRIMHSICDEEKTVSQIVEDTGATQTSVSRHLNLMHRGGVLARRKAGTQVHYRVADAALIEICRSVCKRIADELVATRSEHQGPLQLPREPAAKMKPGFA